jgi:phage-related protein
LGQLLSAGAELIVGLLGTLLGFVGDLLSAGVELIVNFVSGLISVIDDVVSTAIDIGTAIWDTLSSIDLFEIGRNIIDGLINGISSMAESVWSTVTNIAGGIMDTITGALGIHSPSRWMRDMIGKNMMLGWEIGIDRNAKNPQKAMKDALGMVVPNISTEKAVGIGRSGYNSVSNTIIQNTYNKTGQDITELINAIKNQPVQAQLIVDGEVLAESTNKTNALQDALRYF